MPVSTNLQISPYFDDFDELKHFYRVLFKPGQPVQTRELNQLQSMFQEQIERFGDNIFQKGTIIDGCLISFHNVFPYVKLKDAATDGTAINVSDYEGFYLKDSANLQAYVVTSTPGFESQSPDLNTLYLKYLNSGNTSDIGTFSANQVLTVFKPDNRIFEIIINDGSTGFSNSDSIVISSALAVQNSIGGTSFSPTFTLNEYITNGNGANVQIISIDTTTNTDVVILGVKPQASDLTSSNAAHWTISTDEAVLGLTSGAAATVVDLVGSGAVAGIRTNSIGKITNVNMTAEGSGYYVTPFVSVKSTTANTAQINSANLTSQNFLTQVTVAPTITDPVGSGYAITVSEGVIFQKGYFQRVEEQLLVVDAYANTPDAVVVGFATEEEIINSNIDDSLLDNALGTKNYTAPGADRLRLTPTLVVKDKPTAETDTDFFTIVEFSQGAPFKYNKQTVYNVIEQEMARRTAEESGDYVIDTFNVNTKSVTTFANTASQFITAVDPGLAYINGYRVETVENFNGTTDKATDTQITASASISLNYGSYIKVQELGGVFDFSIGSVVGLYDTAKTFLTSAATTVASAGSQIGSARIRSMYLESGTPGSPNATYRLYLFNIQMNSGKSFGSVRSVYQNVTPTGAVADAVLANGGAFLFDSNLSSVIFPSGVTALKNANNISYTYRTVDTSQSITTAGLITKTLGTGESWPVTGQWGATDKLLLSVVPHANVVATANIAGSLTTSTTSPSVVGVGTAFNTTFSPGDYIKFSNTTASGYGRISAVVNATALTLAANASVSISGANGQVYFPQFVPISLNPVRTVNVNSQTITINLGQATNAANVSLIHNVYAANVQPVSKTTTRGVYVRLRLANNTASYTGPWCLGHADVFRLRGVYRGANNTFAPTDTGVTDVTNSFYIDHNQTESTYDTSFLYLKPRSGLTLGGTDTLLIQMDIFTTAAEGMKDIVSYAVDDTKILSNLTTSINTSELPEMYGRTDTYYDIRDCIDFRPVTANTANVATIVSNATINPAEPSYSLALSNSAKKFPFPGSTLTATFEYYQGRVDRVVVTEDGEISVLRGEPGKQVAPSAPDGSLTINLLNIPPYPSYPFSLSTDVVQLLDTKIANEKYSYKRLDNFRISTPVDAKNRQAYQPRGYTMQDIGQLEARIADMEYYISYLLSQIDAIGNIPGNLDGSTAVNRYKYGYFVDPFTDNSRSDINNPEFYASFDNGRLVPRLTEFDIKFQAYNADGATGDVVGIGFTEWPLISQLTATDGSVTTSGNTTPNTGTSNTTTVVQTTANVTVFNRSSVHSSNWTAYEDHEFFMSSTSGAVQMFFNSREDDIAIEIFQSPNSGSYTNAPILTAQNAVTLGSGDFLKMQGMYTLSTLDRQGFQGSPAKYVVDSAGKILWTHNPANGRYYRVRVYKQHKAGDNFTFVYRVYYPVDSVVNVANTTTTPSTFMHNGMITSVTPATFNITSSLTYESNGSVANTYFCDSQKFEIACSGLKPSTKHSFYVDGVDKSSLCKQLGKAVGDNLVSQADGTMRFSYFFDAGLTEVTTDFEQFNTMAASVSGYKSISIKSSDGTSIANGQIHITSSAASNRTTTTPIINSGGTSGTRAGLGSLRTNQQQ